MAGAALYIFWTGIFIVLYTYLGYGIVIFLLSKIRVRQRPFLQADHELPRVTLLIAAFDEEGFIEEKVKNTFALDYPTDKLSIFIVTDGSADRTPDLVRQFQSVHLFHEPERKGKIHAVNRIMKFVETPVVIFSDANTYLNRDAIKNMVRHYQDEKVGGVAGEKRIFVKMADNASGSGEGLYWKYESFLKQKDAEVYSVVGAAGELFSVRTSLFEEPAENMIIEDFYLSLRVAMKGYRFMYEPDAYAIENAAASVAEEWKRKVRISAGGFQAITRLSALLNPLRYGLLSFQYISHRVLRWTLAPLFLPLILISNIVLAAEGLLFYQVILLFQVIFYFIAGAGHLFQNKKISIKGFFVPYYFSVMNLSVYAGFLRFAKGSQSILWDKAARAKNE
ncbi:MAG TPA: glycosyltransferase family 2 protein [Cyclobacteriaceae bacterium]|nr:glycosyltransferase family 2 protein [Cyclobacteriaceae bacterium]